MESCGVPASSPGLIDMHQNGKESAAALFATMSGEGSRLGICTYILGDDAFGREATQRMIERARSGGEGRLLLDGVGAFRMPTGWFRGLRLCGVHDASSR